MQNKSAVLIFTVLLALATLYTLSFNYFSSQFENEAQVQGVYEAEQLLDAGQITDAQFDATAAKEAKEACREDWQRDVLRHDGFLPQSRRVLSPARCNPYVSSLAPFARERNGGIVKDCG